MTKEKVSVMLKAKNILKGGIKKMNKEVQMAKFNSRKQHIFAGNFVIKSNIFVVSPLESV